MHSGNLTAKCQNKSRFALLKVLEDKRCYIRSLYLVQTGYLLQQKNSLWNYFLLSIPHVEKATVVPCHLLISRVGGKDEQKSPKRVKGNDHFKRLISCSLEK